MDMFLNDTLQEILSRLPVRSLMQCRLVCRLWRDLTHDLHFTRIHTSRTLASKPGIMLNDNEKFSFVDRRIKADIPTFYPMQLSIQDIKEFTIFNSRTGLLYVGLQYSENPTYFVYNPFISKFIPIPYHENQTRINLLRDFGFCPKTQSYKIIEILLRENNDWFETTYGMEKYVYKLGDNSWYRIESESESGMFPILTNRGSSASNINGALHWVDIFNGDYLTVFDLEHDVFNEMPGPIPTSGDTTGRFKTFVIENCLSIINYYDNNHYDNIVNVWVMKEYWISWEKCYVINLSTLVLTRTVKFDVFNYEVVGSEILILHKPHILSYNVEENVFTAVLSLEDWYKYFPHFDTLVSPLG